MKNIVISIFDEKFIDYAVKMYKSYKLFDKKTKLYAGSIDLSEKSKKKLNSIDVEVLLSKTKIVPKNLCVCDLLIKDYIENLEWDNLMWIDADTIILRPVHHIFDEPFDFIGHGGNVQLGFFEQQEKSCYPYKSTWISREIENNKLIEKCKWGFFFSMGLWVAKNKNIINDFYDLYQSNPEAYFEGDICSKLLNLKYNSKQLDGLEWSVGTLQNSLLSYENRKVVMTFENKKYYPFQFGYSRINNKRPICNAIEKFYKNKMSKLL